MSDWPQKGDSIRAVGKDERFHSKLDLGRWGFYPVAYLHAAEWLIGGIDSGASVDLIVYPALYLYRHYLELMLKHLISMGHALDSDRRASPEGHKLRDLWDEARPLIAKHAFRPGETQDEIEIVGGVIAEFVALDPFGESFRYSNRKNGDETLRGDDNICLDEVVRVMKRVDNFFVGVESVMDELRQHQNDLEREYQADAEAESF